MISTWKHHLEQIQYTIYMHHTPYRTRCCRNKFKLPKKLPPTHKIRQFQTMEKIKNCHIKKEHPAEDSDWLEPCWKEPKLAQFPFLRNTIMILNTSAKFKRKDLLLIAALNNIQSLPMWTRWNTRKHAKTSPQRLVFCMKHIYLPLTRVDESKKPFNVEKLFQNNMGRKKYALVTYE